MGLGAAVSRGQLCPWQLGSHSTADVRIAGMLPLLPIAPHWALEGGVQDLAALSPGR